MNLTSSNQTKLYGLENYFDEFKELYSKDKLPTKILLSGLKGIGKSTLAYHLINYILSLGEENSYDFKKYTINSENRSYRLIQNHTSLNFNLIDVNPDKKAINIEQIRSLINNLNKSSFNSKPRFVLIDNIEYLNLNSVNALLKVLEEPNFNIHFILIHNNKKVTSTLLSRCLNFKIFLSNKKINEINQNLFNAEITNEVNKDLIDYYFTPGMLYNLLKLSKDKKIELKNLDLNDLITLLINESYYKKDNNIKNLLYDLIEFFILKKISISYSDLSNYFLNRINNCKKFNLDDESLFLEINSKILNG